MAAVGRGRENPTRVPMRTPKKQNIRFIGSKTQKNQYNVLHEIHCYIPIVLQEFDLQPYLEKYVEKKELRVLLL